MMVHDAALQPLIDRVDAARAAGAQLDIRGGDTKRFYGEAPVGEPFDVRGLAGISAYEPTELVVTARCGTPLIELEETLADHGQCLPFEPPHYAPGSTVGGMVAAGLAGPSRASVGAVRDYILGATLLNGRGQVVSFGGQVMKNVAGYDVSRALAGSMGAFGVICEVSLKVLPKAPATATLRFGMRQKQALDALNAWGGQPLPLNASAWWDDMLVLRLRGASAAVEAACRKLGGEVVEPGLAEGFWRGHRDQTDEFFQLARRAIESHQDGDGPALWRLSVPQTAPPLAVSGEQLIEWHGAQRWICTATAGPQLRELAERAGGHATMFRSTPDSHDREFGIFAPLRMPLDRIHRDLKRAFDPNRVFNPGRLYPGL